jgi:hypothetical protein
MLFQDYGYLSLSMKSVEGQQEYYCNSQIDVMFDKILESKINSSCEYNNTFILKIKEIKDIITINDDKNNDFCFSSEIKIKPNDCNNLSEEVDLVLTLQSFNSLLLKDVILNENHDREQYCFNLLEQGAQEMTKVIDLAKNIYNIVDNNDKILYNLEICY